MGCLCHKECNVCIITGYIGAAIAAISILIVIVQPTIVNTALQASLLLVPSSAIWDSFTYSNGDDLPVYLNVWVWSIKNIDDYQFDESKAEAGQNPWAGSFPKPVFEQIGPFVYVEDSEKVQVQFFDENGQLQSDDSESNQDNLQRIQAESHTFYRWAGDGPGVPSGLNPYETLVSFANPVSLAIPFVAEYAVKDAGLPAKKAAREAVNLVLKEAQTLPIIKNMPAHDMLFAGYEDETLKLVHTFCQQGQISPDLCQNLMSLSRKGDTPEFYTGFLAGTNWNSFEWNTGVDDLKEAAQITKFRKGQEGELKSELEFWPANSTCNLLKGTDGTVAPAYMTKEDQVWGFSSDLYRSFHVDFTEETKTDNYDITCYRYELPLQEVAAPNYNPENTCYCDGNFFFEHYDTDFDCYEQSSSMIIATNANSGVPLAVGLPHFLGAEAFLENVQGDFAPSEVEHTTFLEYEPLSGGCMRAGKKIQQSLIVVKDQHYEILDAISELDNTIVMPIVWENESFVIPEDYEEAVYVDLVLTLEIIKYVWIGGLCLGLVLFLIPCSRRFFCGK